MESRLSRFASHSSTVEGSVSPFSPLDSSSKSFNVYDDSADQGSIDSRSPPFSSFFGSHSRAHTPPLTSDPSMTSPNLVLGDVSQPGVVDFVEPAEGRYIPDLMQSPPRPSPFASALSLRSSFFSCTTDSSTSAELLLTSESPAPATVAVGIALPANEAPSKHAASSSPKSELTLPALSTAADLLRGNPHVRDGGALPPSSSPAAPAAPAVTTTTTQTRSSQLTTPSQHVSSPFLSGSVMATQVLPSCTDDEAQEPDFASTSIPISLTPAPAPSTAFPSTPPPLVTSFTGVSDCNALSQLATTLLHVEEADSLVDQLHARSCISTMSLSWAPKPMPTISATKHKRSVKARRGISDSRDSCGEHGGEVGVDSVEKRRRPKKETKRVAPRMDVAVSAEEWGIPAPPPSYTSRRRCISRPLAEGADENTSAATASSDTHLAPAPRLGVAAGRKKKCKALQGSMRSSPTSHTEAAHVSLPLPSPSLSPVFGAEESALVADDVPLSNLFADSRDLSGVRMSVAPVLCQHLIPSVSPRSKGERPTRIRGQRVGSPPTEGAPEDNSAPLGRQTAVDVSGLKAEVVSVAASSSPLCSSPLSAPQRAVLSKGFKSGGRRHDYPVNSSTSAARSTEAAPKGTTLTSSAARSALKRRRSQMKDSPVADSPPLQGSRDASSCNHAVTQAACPPRCVDDVKLSCLRTQQCAVSTFTSGRPCLWIELEDGYQEAHGSLLRQVCVCWGRLHQEGCVVNYGGVNISVNASSQSSTSKGSSHTRTRSKARKGSRVADTSAPFEHRDKKAHNGLIVLLCPSSLSVEGALRWWTQRAHVEHNYMPPLLAVSFSGDSTPGASKHVEGVGNTLQKLTRPLEHGFFKGAIEQASCMYSIDATRSVAVSCSVTGNAVLTQFLPLGQVFDSLRVCADVLGSAAGLRPTALFVKAALNDDVDVGSLTAVLAITPPERGVGNTSSLRKGRRALLVQDQCFEELCRWNDLAVALQQQPRRPQIVLRRICVDAARCDGGASREGIIAGEVGVSFSAASGVPDKVSPALSVTNSAHFQQQQRQWVTLGLVLPAARNEDTFASSAHREGRVLASQPPPVALAPAHMSALHIFGRVLFTYANYTTAVNVVDSYSRMLHLNFSDYLSDYSCITTGPLCYAVSATIRRYLHVRMLVSLSPLLALVNLKTATDQLDSSTVSINCSDVSIPSNLDFFTPVVLLARSQWHTVALRLSCTCNPRVYEQVPHTDDGVKVCRHLAELFHYFVTHNFFVVGHQLAQEGQPSLHHLLKTVPVQTKQVYVSQGQWVTPCTTSVEKRQLSRHSRSCSRSGSIAEAIVDNNSSSLLYTRTTDFSGPEWPGCKEERAKTAPLQNTGSSLLPGSSTRGCSRPCRAPKALPGLTERDSPPTVPFKAPLFSAVAEAGSSLSSSTSVSADGADFHTQALQYALRFVHARLCDLSGGRSTDDRTAFAAAAVAKGGGEPLHQASESLPPARPRKRLRSGKGSEEKTDDVQALRLVEKLLRDQLR